MTRLTYADLSPDRVIRNLITREQGKVLDKTPNGDVRIELLDGPDKGLVLELDPVEVITTWE